MPARESRTSRAVSHRDKRSIVGWQGITVRVPEDWHIGAISGEDEDGYLRIQDDEMVRLEIKWEQAGKFVDMDSVVDKYLHDLERRSQRSQPPMKTRRGSRRKGPDERARRSVVRFGWSGDRQGQGMAWLCEQCSRVVIAQAMAPEGEDIRSLGRDVLGSLRCHSEGGWRTWATYGFVADIPDDFKLSGQKLMTGLIEFSFERDTEKLIVSRRGLADVVLRNTTLLRWTGAEMGPRLRDCACQTDAVTVHGHEAVTISGHKSKLAPRAQRFVRHIMRRTFGDRAEYIIWHCEQANKIIAVESLVDVETSGLAREVAQRVRCH